jgi:hypothetical protein
MAAALGRRNYLMAGDDPLFPNMYTVLVGPPGVRKSTAMNTAVKFIKRHTQVRMSPDDTAGKYQGLVSAMEGQMFDEEGKLKAELDQESAFTEDAMSFDALANMQVNLNPKDLHSMFIAASEWSIFTGINNTGLLMFLLKMWDGEDFEYQLRKETATLRDPLLNMIGCSTPTNIASTLPAEAIGQGFMSRIILVHSSRKYKQVPRRKALPTDLRDDISTIFGEVHYKFNGEFTETAEAAEYMDYQYGKSAHIDDHRFLYYMERRQTHLFKLAMNIAAARLSTEISIEDVMDAQTLLTLTEKHMPDALGEYGMSPTAAAKQKLVEFLMLAKEPVTQQVLWTMMHKEIPQREFIGVLNELMAAQKIISINVEGIGAAYIVKQERDADLLDEIRGALATEREQGHKDPANYIMPETNKVN